MGDIHVPLPLRFPSDRRTLDVDDQFLWGPALMISPVLTPATTQRRVYFPQDAWYDYYSVSDRCRTASLCPLMYLL